MNMEQTKAYGKLHKELIDAFGDAYIAAKETPPDLKAIEKLEKRQHAILAEMRKLAGKPGAPSRPRS
jgi:hypothetical protein